MIDIKITSYGTVAFITDPQRNPVKKDPQSSRLNRIDMSWADARKLLKDLEWIAKNPDNSRAY